MCAVQCIFFTSDAPLGLWMLSFGRAPTRAARLARIRKTFDWPGCFSESLSLGCHTQPVSTIWTKEYYDVLQDVSLWNFMESHGLHGITGNCMELHGIMCLWSMYYICQLHGHGLQWYVRWISNFTPVIQGAFSAKDEKGSHPAVGW